jgi:uncharacterized protein (TIGR03067 family)
MRLPGSFSFVLLIGSAFCLSSLLADDAKPQQDVAFKPFDGAWKVVALEADGKAEPEEAIKGMRCWFKGSEVQFADADEKSRERASVKLDSSKSPKQVDFVVLEGADKGKTIQGIFKFEKDRLVICLRDAEAAEKGRPKEFKTEANSGLGMMTLERVK